MCVYDETIKITTNATCTVKSFNLMDRKFRGLTTITFSWTHEIVDVQIIPKVT